MMRNGVGVRWILPVAVWIACVGTYPCSAATLEYSASWDIDTSPTPTPFQAILTLDLSQASGDYFLVTDMKGTQDGEPVTLEAVGSSHSNDNLFNPDGNASGSPPWVTGNGIGYTESGEGYVFYYDGGYKGCWEVDGCKTVFTVSNIHFIQIPEPSSAWLFATGLVALFGKIRPRTGRKARLS